MATDPNRVDYPECEKILQDLLRHSIRPNSRGQNECRNMYDVRLWDVYPACGMNWPPDLPAVTDYLRRSDVKDALHVDRARNTGWVECNGAVGSAFRTKKSPPTIKMLPDILKEVPIVLFSGAEDLICNHLGTEAMIGNMEWNGGKGFEVTAGNWAPRRDWTFEGEPAGFWQEARNLTYVLFANSSHMVPFDYARRSRDMLDRFMQVDISSIGGVPTDSRLDGEPGPQTSVVGGQDASPTGGQQKAVDEAKWQAYRKSGEVVLVIVAVAAAAWGWYIWRERRKTKGYQGLGLNPGGMAASQRTRGGLDGFRNHRGNRDLEVGDFDESELDDLHVTTPTDMERDRYSVGGDSDDDDEKKPPGGVANGSSRA